ncbi:MAG: glycosyltransferase family 39 protein [Bacteroidota bacterium]|nr:glycosyltransferase family 39 protein [Bacteroidota bacterium]
MNLLLVSKEKKQALNFIALFLLVYLVIFLKLGSFHIRWWDESIYAVNAYEMLHNGNYFLPFFENAPDHLNVKPPFAIWAQLGFIKLFGFNELAVRLPSAIAAALTVFIAFIFIQKRYGYVMAWLTALILISSRGFIGFHTARTADTDSLLTLFTLIANVWFLKYLETTNKNHILLFFLFLTFSFSTKMYAALMFIPAYIIILLRYKKLKQFLFNWQFSFGTLFFFGIAICLLFLREHYDKGYIAETFSQDAGRLFKITLNKEEPFLFYFDNLIQNRFSFWFIPFMIGSLFVINKTKKNTVLLDILIFILSFIGVLTVAKTKFYWYDMPIYPYLSIITAFGLMSIINNLEATSKRNITFMIIALFFYPYCLVFQQSQSNIIPNGEKKLESNEQFIFKRYKEGNTLGNFKVYHAGWKGSLLFYKYKLNEEGIKFDIVNVPDFQISENVLVSDDSLFDIIKTKYKIKLLDKENEARLIRIESSI